MRNTLMTFAFILTSTIYSQVNAFSEDTNKAINEKIKSKNYSYTIQPDALFIIDGKPILTENLQEFNTLKPENIIDINSISKDSKTGEVIWGEKAKHGVVLISTNLENPRESSTAEDSQILFVLDNKIISKEQAYAIDAEKDIETIVVYKNANKFRLFNGDKYDGILVFTSKTK